MARHPGGLPRHVRIAILVALLAVLAVAKPAAGEETATSRLREFFRAANQVLADPALEERPYERLAGIRALVLDLVDFRAAATAALGPAWPARSAGEREQFVRLFAELLQSSLLARVRSRARLEGGLSIDLAGEVTEHDGVSVLTRMTTRTGDDITVAFSMARPGPRWMVRDVVVDGVSLVANYRAQFQRVLQRGSFAELVAEMRERVEAVGASMQIAATPAPAVAKAASVTLVAPATAATVAVVAPASAPATPSVLAPASALAMPPVPAAIDSSAPAPAPAIGAVGAATAVVIPPVPLPLVPSVAAMPPARLTAVADAAGGAPPSNGRGSPPASLNGASGATTLPVVAAATSSAAAPARPVAAKPPRPVTYWVQVGAFQSAEAATRLAAALRDHAITLVTTPGPRPLLRMLLGPFGRRADAVLTLRTLKGRGFDGFLAEGP